ncbi:MAG: hypothetical protein JWP38_3166 [Herbaspirillum sp.]|jgi:predicted  nucleic acid-binding Zn-ribbon protein|nr:hypothetical protein [Herbaspirillum sp.]
MKRSIGFLMFAGCMVLLAGCKPDGMQNYQYFKDNPAEAKSVIGECRLNGTRGMDAKRQAVCDAASGAEQSRKYGAGN